MSCNAGRHVILVTFLAILAPLFLNAQNMARHNSGEVVLVVCPLAGKGTADDPIRPAIVAALKRVMPGQPIEYRWIPSDDGKLAVVEIRTASLELVAEGGRIAAAAASTKYFERGKQSREEVLSEIRKVRRDFQFERFAATSDTRFVPRPQEVRP
ncbi:MAG: hypothetical protein HXY18_15130 [Bryobacteraceae bacterium]|nr:hypothetical protein [Bryobacteraceae bacterium]